MSEGVGGGCTAVVFALCHVGVSEVESGGSIQSVSFFRLIRSPLRQRVASFHHSG